MRRTFISFLAAILTLGSAWSGPAAADEGMWLFDNLPTKALKQKYDFEPEPGWLEHVQKSCVRFGRGGSASIVSPTGLVMTNHHVGRGQLQKLSTAERDLLKDGFYAATIDQELKCNDLEVNVLWSIEDVTDGVNVVVLSTMSAAEANTARQHRIAEITKRSQDETGLKSEVVTLYHGARYHLYRYRRFTDVRLVMAPEADIASFGGDVDNFEYPRFSLDMAFFRIYDTDKPLSTPHYLNFSPTGAKEGELVLVAGHPASTQRLYTVDHLKFLRDVRYPAYLHMLWRREVQLQNFVARSAEHARIAGNDLLGVQNSRKAFTGVLAGLHDPDIMRAKLQAEQALRNTVEQDAAMSIKWADAWSNIAKAHKRYNYFFDRHLALEGRAAGGGSRLFAIARTLVRLADELPKANGERLRGFRDSELDSVYLRLYSPAPIHETLEVDRLTSWFSYLAEQFGGDDPLTNKILAGKSPRARALEIVKGAKVADIAERKRLAEGGAAAIAASTATMIRLAYELDPDSRAVRKRYEDDIESVERESYARIAAAKFAIDGENVYPDATGTLRLTFGTVKGYEESGRRLPAWTTLEGLYKRHRARDGAEPFNLSAKWILAETDLNLHTPFNLVCTTDVIGGNSGSPVFDRRAEVVGLVFDINLPALVWSAAYTGKAARTVAVDSRAIIETLRKVYRADRLVSELISR